MRQINCSLKEEGERLGAGGEIRERDFLDGIEELDVEIVDPELVEVAQDGEGRAVRDDVRPVIEELVVVTMQLFATRFHLDEDALRPHEIGEVLALGPALFRKARLAGGTGGVDAIVA